jgi:hypothetical protein
MRVVTMKAVAVAVVIAIEPWQPPHSKIHVHQVSIYIDKTTGAAGSVAFACLHHTGVCRRIQCQF